MAYGIQSSLLSSKTPLKYQLKLKKKNINTKTTWIRGVKMIKRCQQSFGRWKVDKLAK